jgi:hypothetical protein
MVSPISSFIGHLQDGAEHIHENIDPEYKKQKTEIKDSLQKVGLMSTAAIAASVAFGILGITMTASGGLAAIVGVPLILVSLPLGYLAYNGYRVAENLNEIVDNPKKYQATFGLEDGFDKDKVKAKLKENTFGFSWIIDFAIDQLSKK